MGFTISWLAIQGKPKAAVLAALDLKDTDEPDEANQSPVSGAEVPGGWYMLFFNDVGHPFIDGGVLAGLSGDCTAVVCQAEEHVMASAAFSYANGSLVWKVAHENEQGPRHLAEKGKLPDSYRSIKTRLFAQQDQNDADQQDVDYIWDVPVTLAYELVGYRHDRVELKSGGEARFTRLVPAGQCVSPILPIPGKIDVPDNRNVLNFVRDLSAHSDLRDWLWEILKQYKDVEVFCPDPSHYRYVVVYVGSRIFAFAASMSNIYLRLDPESRRDALTKGALADEVPDNSWVYFRLWQGDDAESRRREFVGRAYSLAKQSPTFP